MFCCLINSSIFNYDFSIVSECISPRSQYFLSSVKITFPSFPISQLAAKPLEELLSITTWFLSEVFVKGCSVGKSEWLGHKQGCSSGGVGDLHSLVEQAIWQRIHKYLTIYFYSCKYCIRKSVVSVSCPRCSAVLSRCHKKLSFHLLFLYPKARRWCRHMLPPSFTLWGREMRIVWSSGTHAEVWLWHCKVKHLLFLLHIR